jgi:hypothetical protein
MEYLQNRYLCDIGDFGKYGMLREVLKNNLILGFNWYLQPDETHNNDGKHKNNLINDRYNVGACDIELYTFLQNVVMKNPDTHSFLYKELNKDS